jgi:DNA-binding Lrp family transcriptional regulator
MNEMATQVNDKGYKIDVGRALEYRLKNKLSYAEIGKQFGASAAAVHKRLQRFKSIIDDPEILDNYDVHIDKMLTSAQMKFLEGAVDSEAIKKASPYQNMTSFGIAFDKQRLVRGLSTNNVSYMDLTPTERDRIRELEAIETSITGTTIVLNDGTSNDE